MSIYNYNYKDINGKDVYLEDFKGKTLMIVNIASKCGFTPQLEDLQRLYLKYKDSGLEIIGFPSNEYLEQSPGSNNDLQTFCKLNYGVTFNLSEKIEVKGVNAHPLFTYLTANCPFMGFDENNFNDKILKSIISEKYPENLVGSSIKWNFTKFLISKNGGAIKRYEPRIEPMDMEDDIKAYL